MKFEETGVNPNAKTVYLRGCTGLTEVPAFPNAKTVYLSGCTGLSNLVSNCGDSNRCLAFANDGTIQIGCFRGTKEQAKEAIRFKYSMPKADEYVSKIEESFRKTKIRK